MVMKHGMPCSARRLDVGLGSVELERLFEGLDRDGDGRVDYTEFLVELEPCSAAPSPVKASPSSAEAASPSSANASGEDRGLEGQTAQLQHFVEEWRQLDAEKENTLDLKQLAILLQRLPVPMGVAAPDGSASWEGDAVRAEHSPHKT